MMIWKPTASGDCPLRHRRTWKSTCWVAPVAWTVLPAGTSTSGRCAPRAASCNRRPARILPAATSSRTSLCDLQHPEHAVLRLQVLLGNHHNHPFAFADPAHELADRVLVSHLLAIA